MSSRDTVNTSMSCFTAPRLTRHSVNSSRVRCSKSFASRSVITLPPQRPEEGPSASAKQRVVKEVSGDTETVTTYDAGGKVVQAHTAKFRLERRGGVPVYTFYDRRITTGAEQGRAEQGPSSYVYKLRGDELDEVWGLLPGQEQRDVVIRHWKRAGN